MTIAIELACVAAFLLISILGLLSARSPAGKTLVYGSCLAVSATAFAVALSALIAASGAVSEIILPLGLPWIGAHFRADALATFFLAVVDLGGGAASLYALGYGRHETAPQRVLPFYPAFLAAMNLVVLADDAFTFLLSWEFMSVTSWTLVMAHHRRPGIARAGYVYLVMASFGTLALLLAFGLFAGPQGEYTFAAIRAAFYPSPTAALVLALALLGAGSKAGLVPLHVWLPLAHPAAPTQVSALLSGVMTKVAVYGFIRIVFDLLGAPSWWSGMAVLTLAAATALLGVLYALMQHDLKRFLAYHTVENIGIIFIGLGLALAFRANGMGAAAALALTAALFHVFNHSLFKSLLFFGAGAVLTVTGERDMERLGGLIHRMPYTSLAFLIGCVSISALPPLNGFVSEWLTFQAILLSPELPQWGLKILIPSVGAVLALSAALAAACFVKAFGVTFLGRPRSAAVSNSSETDGFSLAAMFLLSALCVLAGIVPGFVIDTLSPVVQGLVSAHMPLQSLMPWLAIVPVTASRGSYDGFLVFIFIAFAALASAATIHRVASRALRRAPAWDCGYPDASVLTQYTAGSFAQPIRRVFGTLVFGAREHVAMPPPGDSTAAIFRVELHDPIWEGIYEPVSRAVGFAAEKINGLQFLTIRWYLSVVFTVLVLLLLVLAIWL